MLPALDRARPLPARFADDVAEFRADLAARVMPYWYDTSLDREHGGYLLADDAVLPVVPATTKMLVSQARMVWGFAHAHLNGIRDPERDYLAAAEQGYRFLIAHFRDREHGGYYWLTDLAGARLDDRKFIYGQAFVIYGLVEYYRASGERAALEHAVDLYRTIQARCRDPVHGGWREHAEADWQPLRRDGPVPFGIPGLKSADAHLHWMEALSELFAVTRDRKIRISLGAPLQLGSAFREALQINARFHPRRPGRSVAFLGADWSRLAGQRYEFISFGHLVESAWLMIRAERILGRRPSWRHFRALVDYVLRTGYDHERGGAYYRGFAGEPAFNTDKVWWTQAEMLAALAVGLLRRSDPDYTDALRGLVRFLRAHQIDPQDGIWLDTVAADGAPLLTGKAHNWKAAYHDLRATLMLVDALGVARQP